jgi:hypothetical protein
MRAVRNATTVARLGGVAALADRLIQARLSACQRQYLVTPLLEALLGNRALTAQGI